MLAALLLPSLLSAQPPHLYRWVDDQGHVHYSDNIPPEYTDKGHSVLSPDGLPLRTVPPAKTPEESRRERELERLRAQQQRLIEEQRAADRVLLRTFRSVDDLIMVRDSKLTTLDVMIQITKSNIRRQQDWLNGLRAEAADLERAGKPVPERVRTGIENSERSLKESLAAILERERQKQEIRESFARDLKRFRQLKDLPATPLQAAAEAPMALPNLVTCDTAAECDRRWRLAKDYAQRHATLPVERSGEDVLMTKAPERNDDIGLIVSRIWDHEGRSASIFLDLQCRSYGTAGEDCGTPEGRHVLDGFATAIEAAEARAAAD